MGRSNNNNNNKKSLSEEQTGTGMMRTIKKSCTKAKAKRAGRKTESTLTRTTSLPMARATSSTSHSSEYPETDAESGIQEGDQLEICVSPQDKSILDGTTPKKRSFVKNKNIPGIKSRLGWTPSRFDDRNSTHNTNRHGQRFREYPLRHEYITRLDIDMIENLNRNTHLYDVNEDDLARCRSVTLKMLNNLELIYRKIRRGNKYSHFNSISRNVQRNFRL